MTSMNLPNYFLADLPTEATLSATMIAEAAHTLKRNREQYLANRPTANLVETLSAVARQWLEAEYPFRKTALDEGPAMMGFSQPVLAGGLDVFFRQVTPENLQRLLEQDLGHARRLEDLVVAGPEQKTSRAAVVTAPEFLAHLAADGLATPILLQIIFAVLLRSALLVKCPRDSAFLPRLFAHSIYEVQPKLGACLELAVWTGDRVDLEEALFAQADCVTATGTEEQLAVVRGRVPGKTRFVGWRDGVRFAFVTSGVLSGLNAGKVVARAAVDVAAWDQAGALAPQVIYVEQGSGLSPEHFAGRLAEELAVVEKLQPCGQLSAAANATILSRRSIYERRAREKGAAGNADLPETRLWCSPDSTAWTVVYEADSRFQRSCGNRFIYIKGVKDLTEALQGADTVRGSVSTVGLAAPEDKSQAMATQLARWGVARVCPLGQMQEPALAWRRDGRPALGDLVNWTDWEM